MKIILAPDSFKGSLTAIEITEIMERAIKRVQPEADVIQMPMADGGEGTIDALLNAREGKRISLEAKGPLGDVIQTDYAILDDQTAIIECAKVAGLIQVPEHRRNPDNTTTYGLGEAILDALNRGCTSFVIALGGSATNDGGLGMLQALGMRVFDEAGEGVGIFGEDIHNVRKVDFSSIDPRLQKVTIQIASDVNNPLCGRQGASFVYGRQKGATDEQICAYDESLKRYGTLITEEIGDNFMNEEGAGAAGGLGFALMTLGGKVVSGAQLIADYLEIEKHLQNAHLVITGEGQSDSQTLHGKAPAHIATLASRYNVPTLLISGGLRETEQLNKLFTSCFSIANRPLSVHQCIKQADILLEEKVEQVMRLLINFSNEHT